MLIRVGRWMVVLRVWLTRRIVIMIRDFVGCGFVVFAGTLLWSRGGGLANLLGLISVVFQGRDGLTCVAVDGLLVGRVKGGERKWGVG